METYAFSAVQFRTRQDKTFQKTTVSVGGSVALGWPAAVAIGYAK